MESLIKNFQVVADRNHRGYHKLKVVSHSEPFWTKIQAGEVLKRLADELGRTPKVKDLKLKILDIPMPSINVYYEYFGNWSNALIYAGLKEPKNP